MDVDKDSMPLKQEKQWSMKDKDKRCSQVAKKSRSREANLIQPRTLRLAGQTLNQSG